MRLIFKRDNLKGIINDQAENHFMISNNWKFYYSNH